MSDDDRQRISDKSGRGWYHPMLNMDDDDLDVYEYRLLGHYRRVCGEYNAPCNESTRQTAEKTRMSPAQVSDVRKRLAALGRITLTTGKQGVIIVELEDLWAENIERYSKRKRSLSEQPKCSPPEQPERSLSEQSNDSNCSLSEQSSEGDCSCGEHLKEQIRITTSDQKQEQTPSPSDSEITGESRQGAVSDEKADGDDDGKSEIKLPEKCKSFLESLHEPLGTRVKALPPVEQVAWWYEVTSVSTSKNPAGLLKHLLDQNHPPSQTMLKRAQDTLSAAANRRSELDELIAAAQEHIPQRPAMLEPDDSVRQVIPGERYTRWGDIWHLEKGQLQMRWNQSTFNYWVKSAYAVRYADGVLTVCARDADGRDWLTKRATEINHDVARSFPEHPVRIEFIAPESVEAGVG